MKKFLSILLCAVLLAIPLGLSASAADGDFAGGAKPWFIMPWWLKLQYAVKSWPQMGFKEDSLLILHEGKLVYEKYAAGQGVDVPHAANSVTKSVLSALVGIAVGEARIGGVQDKVADYFNNPAIPSGQESKRDMTIEHLLTMRSGLPGDGQKGSQDCFGAPDAGLAAFLTPQKTAPGRKFKYNSGAGTQCLAGIVKNVTGKTLLGYADEKLFGPLGITGVTWEAVSDGNNKGGMGLKMTSRDMLRLGQLYLNGGAWNGEQLLPAGWSERSQPKVNTILSYGYLFWGNGWDPLLGSSYEARGYAGQFITIYPDKDIVVVRTGH